MKKYNIYFSKNTVDLLHFHPSNKTTIKKITHNLNKSYNIECNIDSNIDIKNKIKYHGSNRIYKNENDYTNENININNSDNNTSINNKDILYLGNIVNGNIILYPVQGYYHLERNKEIKKDKKQKDKDEEIELEYAIEYENNTDYTEPINKNTENKDVDNNNMKIYNHKNINLFKRIKDTIIRRKIVNYNTLMYIYKEEALIKNILNTLTFYCHGRYILKSEYYNENIRERRNKFIKEIIKYIDDNNNINNNNYLNDDTSNAHVNNTDNKNIIFSKKYFIEILQDNIYLYDELIENNTLKGFYEDNIFFEENNNSRILNFIKNKIYCKIDELYQYINNCKNNTDNQTEKDIIHNYIKDNVIVRLSNDCYTLRKDDCKIRDVIVELLCKKKIIRKKEVELRMKEYDHVMDNGEFNKIIKKYCYSKGSNWIIKE